jgi:hypothetical protein
MRPFSRRKEIQMKAFLAISIFSLMLIATVAQAQRTSASACGKLATKFDVKVSPAVSPGLDSEKAIVFIIERDLTTRTLTTPSTRFGMDGEWLGATSGNSYSFFVVSPGIHHLCADTKFGGVGGEEQAFRHFEAKPGATYFFEVRNMRVGDPGWSEELRDVTLLELDEDQGEYLVARSSFVISQPKK